MFKILSEFFRFKKNEYTILGCLIILSYSSSFFVSSLLYMQYADLPVNVSQNNISSSLGTEEEIDTKMILKKNIFNLEVYNQDRIQAIKNAMQPNATNNTALTSGGEFKGQLVGILKGHDKSYALIRTDEKLYILSEKEEKDGMLIDEIGIKEATVVYQGKKYQLKLVGEENEAKEAPKSTSNDEEGGTIKRVVKRKDVEENLSDINSLISTMFISPYYVGGEFVGYRIARMRMDAFLRQAGLENGDVLVRMNGERINTPEKMFELFTKWKDASAVTVDIIRRDQKRTILVEIE